jgi:lipopolysaccharide export system permease protein
MQRRSTTNKWILFKYLMVRITVASCFFVAICMILGELVGVSFEQMRLITDNKISLAVSMHVHIFTAPKFLLMAMPYALFMANIFAYKELSKSSEIVALCSFGICLNKILMPSIILGFLIANLAFCMQELAVPWSNHKAATMLERAMNIDRDNTAIDNFIYSQFDNARQGKKLNLLLHAKKAKYNTMQDVIVLSFDQENLREIIVSEVVYWIPELEVWRLYKVIKKTIDKSGYTKSNEFKVYDLKIKYALNQILNQTRDENELNISELVQRSNIFKEAGNTEEVQKLEKSIQEKFIMPFSCIVFPLVGASIGISLKPRRSGNEFGLGLTIILIYSLLQMSNSALIGQGSIPVYSVWIPSLSGVVFAFLKLARFS